MITFKTKNAQIKMQLSEAGASNLPCAGDRRYQCEIRSPKVVFQNHSFWLAKTDWDQFCRLATKVLTKNLGSAGLKGMSPGAFQLSIEAKPPRDIHIAININELCAGRDSFPKTAVFFEDLLDPEWTQLLVESLNQ